MVHLINSFLTSQLGQTQVVSYQSKEKYCDFLRLLKGISKSL